MQKNILKISGKTVRKHWFFILVFLLITGFYLHNLGNNPYGLFCDEALMGVDAASMLKTGRDSSGTFLPLFPKGFGYYVGGLPTYLLITVVALLGKTDFSIRIISTLFVVFTIPILYAIYLKLTRSSTIASTACLIYALQPLNFHIARININTHSMSTLFILLAYFWFIKATKHSPVKNAAVSGVFMGLSLYGYLGFRIATLIFLLTLFFSEIVFNRGKLKRYLPIIVITIVFTTFYLPHIYLYKNKPEALKRWKEKTSYLTNFSLARTGNYLIKNYTKYYSPKFLFLNADTRMSRAPILRHSIIGFGILSPLLILLIPISFFAIFIIKQKRYFLPFLIWFILYPIPDILTTQPLDPPYTFALYHITLILPFLSVITFLFIQQVIREKKLQSLIFSSIAVLSVIYFSIFYFIGYQNYPLSSAGYWGWQSGPKQIINYFDTKSDKFDELYLSGEFNEPQVFLSFYSINGCKKCRIGGLNNYRPVRKQIFAISSSSFKSGVARFDKRKIKIHKTILYPNGSIAFYIISINRSI